MSGKQGEPTFAMTYQLRAQAHKPALTREVASQLAEDGQVDGACDAMLIMTLSYPEGGGIQGHGLGMDGRAPDAQGNPTELGVVDKFRAWALLAHELAGAEGLDEEQQEVTREAVRSIRVLIASKQARS